MDHPRAVHGPYESIGYMPRGPSGPSRPLALKRGAPPCSAGRQPASRGTSWPGGFGRRCAPSSRASCVGLRPHSSPTISPGRNGRGPASDLLLCEAQQNPCGATKRVAALRSFGPQFGAPGAPPPKPPEFDCCYPFKSRAYALCFKWGPRSTQILTCGLAPPVGMAHPFDYDDH
jgi:hypothetical protein